MPEWIMPIFSRPSLQAFLRAARRLLVACAALTISGLLWALPASAADLRQHQVLVLMSYHQGYSWEDRILRGLKGWGGREQPVFRVEWLDTKRHPGSAHRERMERMLRDKYAGFHFDLIVAVDDIALEIAIGEALFAGTPIVFGGINGDPVTMIGARAGVTGVAERFELVRTLRLALALHEEVRHLLFITSADESGAGMRATIRQALAMSAPPSGIGIEYWTPQDLRSIEAPLGELGAGTIIFALGSIPLVEGARGLEIEEVVAFVRARTPLPLYTDLDAAVGHGAIGGYLNSGLETGRLMASMAQRILAGEAAESIPIVYEAPVALLFDHAELQRFGIPARALPDGSTVVNAPLSILDRQSRPVLLAFSAIVSLLLIIASGLVVRNRVQASRQAALHYQATHDDLTGLPNRTWLTELFSLRNGRGRHRIKVGKGGRLALVMLDLNRFKLINDTYGHSVGDELVVSVARRIKACLGEHEFLVRFSGDAFVILSPLPDEAAHGELNMRCGRMLSEPFFLDGRRIQVSAAFGVSIACTADYDLERLLREADTAMHEAKREGGGQLMLFDHRIHERTLREYQIESKLPSAIESGEIKIHFQPVVDSGKGQIVGFEALARWQDDELGQLPPAEFVRIATASGHIGALTLMVLRLACDAFRPYLQLPSSPYVAVNVSVSDLYGECFPDTLMSILEEEGIPPQRLVLEVTEDMLLGDTATVTAALARLRDNGVRIAIDDFGTGYSSMSYLSSHMVNIIKIDQSFVRRIVTKESDQKIVRAIVSMAADLELSVITEGVETEEQVALLRDLGCVLLQGYAYGRPRPPHEWVPHAQRGLRQEQL